MKIEVREMKLKITEVEATAEELRQSNTLSDGLTRILRNAFNSPCVVSEDEGEDEENE
jgi:hypothetical protein